MNQGDWGKSRLLKYSLYDSPRCFWDQLGERQECLEDMAQSSSWPESKRKHLVAEKPIGRFGFAPPSCNSGKWRFMREPPTKNVIVLLVVKVRGVFGSQDILTYCTLELFLAAPLMSGIIRLPILRGSNNTKIYGKFWGFPVFIWCIVWVGNSSPLHVEGFNIHQLRQCCEEMGLGCSAPPPPVEAPRNQLGMKQIRFSWSESLSSQNGTWKSMEKMAWMSWVCNCQLWAWKSFVCVFLGANEVPWIRWTVGSKQLVCQEAALAEIGLWHGGAKLIALVAVFICVSCGLPSCWFRREKTFFVMEGIWKAMTQHWSLKKNGCTVLLTTAGENSGTWWPPICFSRNFFLVPFCPKLATKFFLCFALTTDIPHSRKVWLLVQMIHLLHQVGYMFFFLEGTSKIFQRGRENSNFHPYKLEMLQFEHWLNHQLEQRCLIPGEEFQFVIPLSITADVKRPPVLRKTATLESGDGGGFAPLFLEVSSWRKVRDCILYTKFRECGSVCMISE